MLTKFRKADIARIVAMIVVTPWVIMKTIIVAPAYFYDYNVNKSLDTHLKLMKWWPFYRTVTTTEHRMNVGKS